MIAAARARGGVAAAGSLPATVEEAGATRRAALSRGCSATTADQVNDVNINAPAAETRPIPLVAC
jgi:hypothetical protein